ncbi:response regulator [Ningiella sp. W23]|uniref:PAS domain-containing hybrid sensor histidine kinase/response regulator n=1 Tax=Ningiella sp. W23 TaxID=3023715 RepID=UPI0037563E47
MHRLESELYELIENDRRIFSFIEKSCLDGLWYWDLDAPEYEWMSPNFWLTLGFDPKEKRHLAEEWQELIFKEDLDLAVENFQKHCADPDYPYDQVVRYRHKLGHTVWIKCSGMAIRDKDGNPIRMLGAHTDITKIKSSELKMKEVIALRERFFARMSHEIRTPLHGIIGITDMLKLKNTDMSISNELETIASCGEQLLVLLDDLLTLGTLQEDKLNTSVEAVPLAVVLNYVSNLNKARALSKGLTFRLEIPDEISKFAVQTDKIRLTQIIGNLVNNAIKYTDKGLVCISASRVNDHIKILVSDSGAGIKDVDKAFEAYSRETAQVKEVVGAGLGLEIVARLCKELGHTLSMESELDKGTRVSVDCKIAFQTQVPETIDRASTQALKKDIYVGNVLIVDDNEINLEIAKSMLKEHAARLHWASSGEEAIEKAKQHADYDVILMDLNMPGKDGFQTTRDILSEAAVSADNLQTELLSAQDSSSSSHMSSQKIPIIIAVSADGYNETLERCRQAGMHSHLTKPFTKQKLLSTLLSINT